MFREDRIVTDGEDVRILPGVRVRPGQKCGVDECTAVFPLHRFGIGSGQPSDAVRQVARTIAVPMGLKLGEKKYDRGINLYKFGQDLADGCGLLAAGGNGGTLMMRITGHGSRIASDDWEVQLHRALVDYDGHLTRIDLAYDDFEGAIYPVRSMPWEAQEGSFQLKRGGAPKFEQRGEWLMGDPNGKGLTFYVGDRCSKLARVYEKGKQLGDSGSPWVRFEVELHSSLYVLVPDMLVNPTAYFAACYPICERIYSGGDRKPLQLRKKAGDAELAQVLSWLRTSSGHYLRELRELYGDAGCLDLVCRSDGVPTKLMSALAQKSPEELASLRDLWTRGQQPEKGAVQ